VACSKSIWPNFFYFKQSAWCREWGACDLGPLSTCMNYCFLLGLLVAGNRPKPVVCAVSAAWMMIESLEAHLRQVLPETSALLLRNLRYDSEVLWEKAMGCTQVKEWFMQFKEEHTPAEDGERSGRPSTSRNQLLTKCLLLCWNNN